VHDCKKRKNLVIKECRRREENKGWEGLKVERERRAKSVWQPIANDSFTMYNQIQTSEQNDALGSQNELKEKKNINQTLIYRSLQF